MIAILILALLFGLIIGSFLNVCIYRWPRDLSVVQPRSHCIACEKTISWYDNIPVVSFAMLHGRCRYCGARIPWRYPLVELLTGFVFVWFAWTLDLTLVALKLAVLATILIALIFTDLEERILPDELTLGGAAAGLVFAGFVPMPESFVRVFLFLAGYHPPPRVVWIMEAALGALIPAFVLWLAGWIYERVRHREGLGLGDVKLVALMGAYLGLSGALLTLAAGSVMGVIIGYGYIRATGKDPSTFELPFGSFLGVAGIAIAMGARQILGWYGGQ